MSVPSTAIGRVDGENTTNNHRATTVLDVMITNRFFVRLPSYEFYSDEFQNIDAPYIELIPRMRQLSWRFFDPLSREWKQT